MFGAGEGTAAAEGIKRPLEFLKVGMKGVRTAGPMAPDVDLSGARPAEDVHEAQVEAEMERIKREDPEGYKRATKAA